MPQQYSGSKLVKKSRRNSSTGEIEQSRCWYLRYKDPRTGKPRYICTAETEIERAEDFKNEKLKEILAGVRGDSPPAKHVPVLNVLDAYWTYKKESLSAKRLKYSLAHLIGFWEGRTVSEINKETIKHYCAQTVRAKSTLKRELHNLRSAVNHAITMERLAPYEFPKIPIKEQPRKKSMTTSEVAKLLLAARAEFRSQFHLRLFIIVGYYSGARKSAILGLKWEQIDFDRNTIDFRDPELEETKKKRS
jgi:integrase